MHSSNPKGPEVIYYPPLRQKQSPGLGDGNPPTSLNDWEENTAGEITWREAL